MSERSDLYRFVNAWGAKTAKALIDSASKLQVKDTGNLLASIKAETQANGGNVNFSLYFNDSGRFVDMGVGRGVSLSEKRTARRERFKGRKAKKWYSKVFYGRLNALESGLSLSISEKAINTIKGL